MQLPGYQGGSMHMRNLPRWEVQPETLIRLTAFGEGEAWVYQYHPSLWRVAVKRIMDDFRREKIPEAAASGLVSMIASGATHAH
jgi:hypothetical protein